MGCMTVVELVEKLKAGNHRADVIARLVGYAAMIQRLGWDNLPINRASRYNLERDFRMLDIDPFKIEF